MLSQTPRPSVPVRTLCCAAALAACAAVAAQETQSLPTMTVTEEKEDTLRFPVDPAATSVASQWLSLLQLEMQEPVVWEQTDSWPHSESAVQRHWKAVLV